MPGKTPYGPKDRSGPFAAALGGGHESRQYPVSKCSRTSGFPSLVECRNLTPASQIRLALAPGAKGDGRYPGIPFRSASISWIKNGDHRERRLWHMPLRG